MKEKFSLEWILKNYSLLFKMINIPESLVKDKYNEYGKLQPNKPGKDFLWSLFNFLIIETSKNPIDEYEMSDKHSRIYFEMALFRRKYEKSKANNIYKLKLDSELRSFKPTETFKMKVEIISNKCCDYCTSVDGKRFELDDAIENKYYDPEKCTWEYGCRGYYVFRPARDQDGRLIPIEIN